MVPIIVFTSSKTAVRCRLETPAASMATSTFMLSTVKKPDSPPRHWSLQRLYTITARVFAGSNSGRQVAQGGSFFTTGGFKPFCRFLSQGRGLLLAA